MTSGTSNFANLRVAALESRNAVEIGRLIEKFGWQPNTKLRDGMEKTYRWIYEQMTQPGSP